MTLRPRPATSCASSNMLSKRWNHTTGRSSRRGVNLKKSKPILSMCSLLAYRKSILEHTHDKLHPRDVVVPALAVRQINTILSFTGLQIVEDASGCAPEDNEKLPVSLLIDLRGGDPLSDITGVLVRVMKVVWVVRQVWLPVGRRFAIPC